MLVQEGVKFSAAGDIGVGNIKLAQTANVDKVKYNWVPFSCGCNVDWAILSVSGLLCN